jgi:HPt (histidine-containing phosphotransfer) domain-containing protein
MSGAPIFDRKDALERMDGDESLLEELLDMFQENFAAKKAEIAGALERGDAEAVRQVAHSVKGSAANLSLMAFREAAYELETAGKEGRLDEARRLFQCLQSEFERVRGSMASGAGGQRPAQTAPPAGKTSGKPEGQKKKILIIDDARDTRSVMKLWAEEAGIAADAAADGPEAVRWVEA